jgi:hypothetical protein
MRARPRGSLEIPHTRIASDTRGFGKNGVGHKRQDGMLDRDVGAERQTHRRVWIRCSTFCSTFESCKAIPRGSSDSTKERLIYL